jgi:23S rRNA (uracil1939-C5)-methyltransferase
LSRKLSNLLTFSFFSHRERALSGQFEEFDILLVDPPRKGLDQEVIDSLIESKTIKRLIYVSCGFKAFQDNARQLTRTGKWVISFAEGHILFPGADHVETLAIFDRVTCL